MENNEEYKHGGSPLKDLMRFGFDVRDVLDFSVNLNPLGPPELIKHRWMELLKSIQEYPSIEGDGISLYYRKKFRIPSRNFLSGNGSTEMIYLLPRVLRFRQVAVITPSYHDYERASLLAGAKVVRYPLNKDEDFSSPDVDEMVEAVKDVDALWVGRPNNPTGSIFPKKIILELAVRFPDKYFLVDEAFIQFVDDRQKESLLNEQPMPNILVVHSLTKFYALAGLR
ncbi:MAG: aminotransferase class I/II-fold pyridoxal phosphate-dependent enzyme, partial [Deltaproteobacteria bacterium]|nr:aminotransferase class I/II-fold pyridoxal phosphate-dependent enzyme [Deltaproteobacteria bacterium]